MNKHYQQDLRKQTLTKIDCIDLLGDEYHSFLQCLEANISMYSCEVEKRLIRYTIVLTWFTLVRLYTFGDHRSILLSPIEEYDNIKELSCVDDLLVELTKHEGRSAICIIAMYSVIKTLKSIIRNQLIAENEIVEM